MAQGRFIATVLGKAGSGKTYLIRSVFPRLPRPVFVLDTLNEFDMGVQFQTSDEIVDFLMEGRPNRSGVYVLNTQTDEDSEALFSLVATMRVPCTLVVDEVDLFCNPHQINADLRDLIRYGRHWKVNLLFAARRAAEVNRNVTAQSDVLISFRQTETRDIQSLKLAYSEAERLPELQPDSFEFIVFGDLDATPFRPVLEKMPMRTFTE
jgi:Cdc6-like AAA superfamily ATPase